MNSRAASIWLAARTGSSGSAVKSASTWLSAPAAVTWRPWPTAREKGWAKVRSVSSWARSGGARSVSSRTRWSASAACRPSPRSVASAIVKVGGRVHPGARRGMETGRAQEGGAAGELGGDLVGQAGAGERGHVDGHVGLGRAARSSPPVPAVRVRSCRDGLPALLVAGLQGGHRHRVGRHRDGDATMGGEHARHALRWLERGAGRGRAVGDELGRDGHDQADPEGLACPRRRTSGS